MLVLDSAGCGSSWLWILVWSLHYCSLVLGCWYLSWNKLWWLFKELIALWDTSCKVSRVDDRLSSLLERWAATSRVNLILLLLHVIWTEALIELRLHVRTVVHLMQSREGRARTKRLECWVLRHLELWSHVFFYFFFKLIIYLIIFEQVLVNKLIVLVIFVLWVRLVFLIIELLRLMVHF